MDYLTLNKYIKIKIMFLYLTYKKIKIKILGYKIQNYYVCEQFFK